MKPGNRIAVAVNRNDHQINRADQFKGFGKIQELMFISDGNSTYVDFSTLGEVLNNMNVNGDSTTTISIECDVAKAYEELKGRLEQLAKETENAETPAIAIAALQELEELKQRCCHEEQDLAI